MSENDEQPVNYADLTPDFTEKEIQDSIKYKKGENGIYLWRVSSAVQAISKADKPTAKGWYMIAEEWTALRPSDRAPSMMSVRTWTLLPLMPNPIGLSKVGYEGSPEYIGPDGVTYPAVIGTGADGKPTVVLFEGAPPGGYVQWTGRIGSILATFDPNGGPQNLTLQKFKDRMRAFQKDSIPRLSDKNSISKEAYEKERADQMRVVKNFARTLFGDPALLVGTEHYAELYYERQKDEGGEVKVVVNEASGKEEEVVSDFPSVRYPRNVADPPRTSKAKGGILKPILDPFISYK